MQQQLKFMTLNIDINITLFLQLQNQLTI